jgi:hypothetical protein
MHCAMFGKKKAKKEGKSQQEVPEASFSNLVLMLATGAYSQLGLVPDPLTKETKVELALAKNTIDLLIIIRKKTKGNLSTEEKGFLDNILKDLQMKFVEIKKKEGK